MSGRAAITGASSGIGAATARALAEQGWSLAIGARRTDRLAKLAADTGARAFPLDVTDPQSVEAFAAQIDKLDLLVCSAGGAFGLDPIATAHEEDWQAMWDVNVMGTVRVIQRFLPALIDSGDGQVIMIGSLAGLQPYPGGGGYNAVKYAVHAVRDVLRLELLGQPVRISEVAPGMVHTDFSLNRFGGDVDRTTAVYADMTPLAASDIADCVAWIASRPSHVNIDRLVVLPRDQADARAVHRRAVADNFA